MKYLKNLSVATLLALSFGFAVVVLIAQGITGYVVASMSRTLVHTTVANTRVNFDLSIQVRERIQSAELHMRRMSVLVDVKAISDEVDLVIEDDKQLRQTLEKFALQDLSDEDRQSVGKLQKLQLEATPYRDEVVGLLKAMQTDQANAIFEKKIDPLSEQRKAIASRLSENQRKRLDQSFEQIDVLAENSSLISVGSTLLGTVAALLAGLLMYKTIAPPLAEAVQVADKIASGDMTIEIHSNERNELGNMMRSMGAMARKMRSAIAEIGDASRTILTASAEIADGNLDLSVRTERQSIALQRATQSVDEISQGVRENAESSRVAKQQALDAAKVATSGGNRVARLSGTMDAISKSSKEIAEIVGVINGIAFQTNILALNAAVEAARAGEQGRGFAVVASEVRTLAQRSAESARQIRELVEANLSTVSAGVEQVTDAGHAIKTIVKSSDEVASVISKISDSSNRQSGSIILVQSVMLELEDGVRQNSALVEQAAAAAESLKMQTIHLNEAIKQFKVSGAEAPRLNLVVAQFVHP